MISEVDDMLLPFNSRMEVNMFRKAAYSRYPGSHNEHLLTILQRKTKCRLIMNLTDVEKVARSFSRKVQVVSFESTSFAYQVNTMRNTDILISIHGAALVNIIFMQPKSVLMEFIHPSMKAPFYKLLSVYASLRYIEFRHFSHIDECSKTNWDPHLDTNLYVDLSALNRTLSLLYYSLLSSTYLQQTP